MPAFERNEDIKALADASGKGVEAWNEANEPEASAKAVLKEIEKADAKTYDQYALGYGESWLEGTRFGLGLARNFITAEFGLQDEEEPAAEETDRDEVLKVAHGMVKYGGGFILELGHALYHADEDNACLIKNTWPKYWAEFLAATQAEEAKKKDDGQTD